MVVNFSADKTYKPTLNIPAEAMTAMGLSTKKFYTYTDLLADGEPRNALNLTLGPALGPYFRDKVPVTLARLRRQIVKFETRAATLISGRSSHTSSSSPHGCSHRRRHLQYPRKTPPQLLANLEHELRLPRHSVRLCAAKQQHEPDFRNHGGQNRRNCLPLAGGAHHGPAGAARHRLPFGPHLEPALGPAAAAISSWARCWPRWRSS